MMAAPWQELRLTLTADRHDLLQELLQTAGALAQTTSPGDSTELFEPQPGETPLWPELEVAALFPAAQDLAPLTGLLSNAGFDVQLREVADDDWARRTTRWQAARFGERLWVCPTGTRPTTGRNAVVVSLDPGLAFGTGSHPTTRLCLEWLDAQPLQRREVIDYGCGSGILAIAAAKLGAAQVQAIDIDPQALAATRRNAERNNVAERVLVLHDNAEPGRCDLLLANILKQPLILLADRFARCLRPGGDLVLSGLLAAQVPEVQKSYAAAFRWIHQATSQGWALLHGVRRNPKDRR